MKTILIILLSLSCMAEDKKLTWQDIAGLMTCWDCQIDDKCYQFEIKLLLEKYRDDESQLYLKFFSQFKTRDEAARACYPICEFLQFIEGNKNK